jgi:hypothetical protein
MDFGAVRIFMQFLHISAPQRGYPPLFPTPNGIKLKVQILSFIVWVTLAQPFTAG